MFRLLPINFSHWTSFMKISTIRTEQDTSRGGYENSESYDVTVLTLRRNTKFEGPVGFHGDPPHAGAPWSIDRASWDNYHGADLGEPSTTEFSWKGAALHYWETYAAGSQAPAEDDWYPARFKRNDLEAYPGDEVAAAGGAEGLDLASEIHRSLDTVGFDRNLVIDGDLASPRIRNSWTGEELARIDISGDRVEFRASGADQPVVASGEAELADLGRRIQEFGEQAGARVGAEHADEWLKNFQHIFGSFPENSTKASRLLYQEQEFEDGMGDPFKARQIVSLTLTNRGAEISSTDPELGYSEDTRYHWAPLALHEFETLWNKARADNPEAEGVQRQDNRAHEAFLEARDWGGIEALSRALPIHQAIETHLESGGTVTRGSGLTEGARTDTKSREVDLWTKGTTVHLGTVSFDAEQVSWTPGRHAGLLLGRGMSKPLSVNLDDGEGLHRLGWGVAYAADTAMSSVQELGHTLKIFAKSEASARELMSGLDQEGKPLLMSAVRRQSDFNSTAFSLRDMAEQLSPAIRAGIVAAPDQRTKALVSYWASRTDEQVEAMTVEPEKGMHRARRLLSMAMGGGR